MRCGRKANMTDNKFGVLLSEEAWQELGEVLKPYQQEGAIGKYLYCKDLHLNGLFVAMTFTPKQIDNRIDCEMRVFIPSHFVKFIAESKDPGRAPIGF